MRDQIHKLFDDIQKHYEDYKIQKQARLSNKEYTLTSAIIEWGDLSLYQALSKYFNDEHIIDEFTLVYGSVGLDAKSINAYHYFIKFFDTFIDGSHFIKSSFDDVVKTLSSEISKTREKIFVDRAIDKVILEDDVIKRVIDDKGVEIEAKHFVINMRIDDFVDRYLPERLDIKEKFHDMYPGTKEERFINQVYLGFNKPAEDLGLAEKQYIYNKVESDDVQLLSILNYKAYDAKACPKGKSAVLVEFLDDSTPRKTKLEQVVKQFL